MELFCIIISILFYLAGLLTPFIAETMRFINFMWKDYVRNRQMKDKANDIARSQLARRQIEIMKILVNGK